MRKNGKNLLCAGICILALTGCSMNSYATTAAAAQTEKQQEQPPKDTGILAKITSVDNRTITVILADKGEKPADGMTLPEKPEENASLPEKPADNSGQAGSAEREKRKPEMNFDGEAKTYTIPDSAVITKGMEQESASVSDLTVDTVVRITLDGDTVSGISIMN